MTRMRAADFILLAPCKLDKPLCKKFHGLLYMLEMHGISVCIAPIIYALLSLDPKSESRVLSWESFTCLIH